MYGGTCAIVRLQAGKAYGLFMPNINIAETKSALSITYEVSLNLSSAYIKGTRNVSF